MKRTFYLVVIFVYFLKTKSQVLNKAELADRDELKFLVFLKTYYSFSNSNNPHGIIDHRGAGTIIRLNWVLTAAHVVEDYDKTVRGVTTRYSLAWIELVAGTKHINSLDGKQQFMIDWDDVYVHPQYSKAKHQNDIALINLRGNRLQKSATVEPAKLLTSKMNVVHGVDCVVCGWGYSHTATKKEGRRKVLDDDGNEVKIYARNPPAHARKGIVQLLKDEMCNRIFPSFDSKEHFCYGCDYGGSCQQTAKGDSGSPVVCAFHKQNACMKEEHPMKYEYVFAVHNFGCDVLNKKCTSEGPSFGTNVATKEIEDWMNQRMETDVLNEMNSYAIAAATIVGAVFVYIL